MPYRSIRSRLNQSIHKISITFIHILLIMTACSLSPNPALEDLKLTFHESTLLVSQQQQQQQQQLFLSNIDISLNFKVPNASFFQANPDYPPPLATRRIKSALHKLLLGPYHFMAGRLKLNHLTERLEIDCNGAGAGFVAASSELSLDEIGDLARPNLGFQQLAPHTLPNLVDQDQPLCIIQVTSFKCGGFAIGMSVNHTLLDGMSAKHFTENLASQAFDLDKPLAVVPFLDRTLLSARSPPRVSFPHLEFQKPADDSSGGPPAFYCSNKEQLEFGVFKLTPTEINLLKHHAKTESNPRISTFSVTAALVWRCKALSSSCNEDDKVTTLLNVVDLRSRLDPPLPSSYCGSAVLDTYASVKREEIGKVSFAEVVKMVSEGPMRMTDEYARSAIDWLEINKQQGLPSGEYTVSSWLRLGFEQVEYPWGKPLHSGPVVKRQKGICLVFPTADGVVNALVSLPYDEMKRFESEFSSFIAKLSMVVGMGDVPSGGGGAGDVPTTTMVGMGDEAVTNKIISVA